MSEQHDSPHDASPRSTVARGAAWAVPAAAAAVVAASASPASAAADCSVTPSLTRLSCLDVANQSYQLVVCFNNSCDTTVDLALQSILFEGTGSITPSRLFYTIGRFGSQCQQVTFRYANAGFPPPTLTLNYVYAPTTPGAEQVRASVTIDAPRKPCC